MVILASLALGGGLPDEADVERLLDKSRGLEVTTAALSSVYVLDYLFTLFGYWVKQSSGESPAPEDVLATPQQDPAQQRRDLDAQTSILGALISAPNPVSVNSVSAAEGSTPADGQKTRKPGQDESGSS
jgi:hypothetical protein